MSNFTTALLGSFSRILFPSARSHTGIPASHSDPDVFATGTRTLRSSNVQPRPRPSSAIDTDRYWSWEGPGGGMILRPRAARDLGLKGLADVTITHASPVLACQPPRARAPTGATTDCQASFDIARSPSPAGYASAEAPRPDFSFTIACSPVLHDIPTPDSSFESARSPSLMDYDANADTVPTPDSSFDISLISDTSTDSTSASDEQDAAPDAPFTAGLGLGLCGLFKPMARLSTAWAYSLSDEAAWTWAANPHHRVLSVIQEDEELKRSSRWYRCSCARPHQEQEHAPRTRAVPRKRDLSTVTTISSGLKKRQAPRATKTPASVLGTTSSAQSPRAKTLAPNPRTKTLVPSPRSPSACRASPAWRS
ncbi:hypothetical protein B0H17DRAFT_1211662 [Mycena rosella]|uniref:Uncharacterized protein n=1 Tax=Mycena rosella TaxID=1033263 RepID=A0AAD7G3U6_MYCRO|nr:hypothetical protein B0H17DRAFT_1211662 [Mycena rosella]